MMASLAERLLDARQNGELLPRDAAADIQSRAEAYDVQAELTELSGKSQVGWKVAATSVFAQKLLSVPGPSLGPICIEDVFDSGVSLPATPEHATAVECEFAFVMGTNPVSGGEVSRDDIIAATEQALIAIEVVGSRYEGGFKGIGELRCITDCSMNSAFVRGAPIANWYDLDLSAAEAAMKVNGNTVNQGKGADVLGDPIEALRWAAREAATLGQPLRAGDIVSTGTMTGATVVHPGDKVVGDFGPFGTVEINF